MLPTKIKKISKSFSLIKQLRRSKSSSTVVIVSGGPKPEIPEHLLKTKVDFFTNSSAYSQIPHLEGKVACCFFGRDESQNSSIEYKRRVKDALAMHQSAIVIADSFDEYEECRVYGNLPYIRYAYLLPLLYPFLRAHNGPTFLIWLAFYLGYKRIVLHGVESTMIKGLVLSAQSPNISHNINLPTVHDVCINNALMIFEYSRVFKKIFLKADILQLSRTSWSQPDPNDQYVLSADDSWTNQHVYDK